MLDFSLTDEQLQAAAMVREFGAKEITPTIKEYDRQQTMNPIALPRMAELGILGINIPVRYGGQGFDYVTLGLVCEELERIDTTLLPELVREGDRWRIHQFDHAQDHLYRDAGRSP